jgi:hypothetical protein
MCFKFPSSHCIPEHWGWRGFPIILIINGAHDKVPWRFWFTDGGSMTSVSRGSACRVHQCERVACCSLPQAFIKYLMRQVVHYLMRKFAAKLLEAFVDPGSEESAMELMLHSTHRDRLHEDDRGSSLKDFLEFKRLLLTLKLSKRVFSRCCSAILYMRRDGCFDIYCYISHVWYVTL